MMSRNRFEFIARVHVSMTVELVALSIPGQLIVLITGSTRRFLSIECFLFLVAPHIGPATEMEKRQNEIIVELSKTKSQPSTNRNEEIPKSDH